MSIEATAVDVLRWACGGHGAPPRGLFAPGAAQAGTGHDAQVPVQVQVQAARLLALTAARLRLGSPPLADGTPLRADALLRTAAAVGFRDHASVTQRLLDGVLPPQGMAGLLACHGIVLPALPHLGAALREDLLRLSPLTALAWRPADGTADAAASLAERLARHPAGRRWLTLTLACPTEDIAVRGWRQTLLARCRLHADPAISALPLDVFEVQAVHFEAGALQQVRRARAVLMDALASADERRARDALSVAGWWQPLWELRRADGDALRQRRGLGYGYLEGLALCALARKLVGGALQPQAVQPPHPTAA